VLTYLGVFLLSASALAFEIVLSRLFSIAQFYHFAFMTVSLALLGAGASGTALTVFPSLHRGDPARRMAGFALGTAWATLGSFVLANWLPFDSFAHRWDGRQVVVLVLMYLALAGPFFLSGLVVGGLLAARPATHLVFMPPTSPDRRWDVCWRWEYWRPWAVSAQRYSARGWRLWPQ